MNATTVGRCDSTSSEILQMSEVSDSDVVGYQFVEEDDTALAGPGVVFVDGTTRLGTTIPSSATTTSERR
jgi:hypothetical protein